MKKDIEIRKVEQIGIAIVPAEEEKGKAEGLWEVFLINLKPDPIRNVLVSSVGRGTRNGEAVETSVLRHYIEEVGGNAFAKVENIQTLLFDISNEFWVSFTYDDFMFDKRYTFVSGSISPDHFSHIPLLKRQGVMIQ
ncbi:MAG: hypothetical protein AAGI38_17785 [Bacteroidota bacterium]